MQHGIMSQRNSGLWSGPSTHIHRTRCTTRLRARERHPEDEHDRHPPRVLPLVRTQPATRKRAAPTYTRPSHSGKEKEPRSALSTTHTHTRPSAPLQGVQGARGGKANHHRVTLSGCHTLPAARPSCYLRAKPVHKDASHAAYQSA